jgi:nitrate reductase delta subunit
MGAYEVVALGYRYPNPTSLEALRDAVNGLSGAVTRKMQGFLDAVEELDLAEWEELHTATLDLSPLFVPYVGHVVWGENYRRGRFMADLKADMERIGVDLGGELPDHIEPILRYLAVADPPRADLTDVIGGAVEMMRKTLHKAAADNPYNRLLDATAVAVEEFGLVTIRTGGASATPGSPDQ